MTDFAGEPHQAEISAAERWQLIERVLNSREFKRALRLKELLHYIGSQTVKAGVTSLREQEIGEAVFGRPGDYDTSLDNIVRVNVTELRKRLSLYFEDEGLAERLHIEIPRGGYIPVFSRVAVPRVQSAEASPAPADGDHSDSADAVPAAAEILPARAPDRRVLWILSACLAALGITVGVVVWQNAQLRTQLRPWQADAAVRAFWSQFFGRDEEVDIVTADTSYALAQDILQHSISLNDYLDYKYRSMGSAPGVSEDKRSVLDLIFSRDMGSTGDYRVAERLMELAAHAGKLRLASARSYAPESVKANNVILIGASQSNPWVSLYKDRLNFLMEYDPERHSTSIVNRMPAKGEKAVYELVNEANRGYSVVAFLPNLSGRHYALLIQGTDSQATLAAGEWVTSAEGLAAIRQKAPQGPFPFFEVLLSSSKLEFTPLRTELVAFRIHPR